MSVSMTAKAWWTSFSRCNMAASTIDACPVCVFFPILSSECVLFSCSLVALRLPVSVILCCALVLLLENYFYVSWFGAYGLFLWTHPPSELMVRIIGLLEDLAAS